jgi:hypothetical protein
MEAVAAPAKPTAEPLRPAPAAVSSRAAPAADDEWETF